MRPEWFGYETGVARAQGWAQNELGGLGRKLGSE